jgi:hypothetical protein
MVKESQPPADFNFGLLLGGRLFEGRNNNGITG